MSPITKQIIKEIEIRIAQAQKDYDKNAKISIYAGYEKGVLDALTEILEVIEEIA